MSLYPRDVSLRPLEAISSRSFTVLQFNVLADGLSGLREDKGGFILAPGSSLSWSFRSLLLLEEILRFSPDVVCLQEVDHFDDWFEPELRRHGFFGLFAPKPHSPCLFVNDKPDGCAVFFKESSFFMLSHSVLNYAQSNQVALIVDLQHKESDQYVRIACTHLKATKNASGEVLREEQAKILCASIGSGPIVVCGDFNATPDSHEYPALAYKAMRNHGFDSAYCIDGKEPEYTTWKVRSEKESKHTIDYIFYTPSTLQVLGTVNAPVEMEECALPSLRYPSDHIALIAKMQWV
ncbi:hypothetical protein THRCLA_12005 [Thraustotheca clavata]|uniref:Endonuclease/exonuclease/phosphatase domain-containing protein n=1 Tax=Thraustotheca clavata TaxID=74557 RepID=A0A1V9Y471_9STRA|nr:hypothetical protein THRCLA_12005 [Thraustotheca clavata]